MMLVRSGDMIIMEEDVTMTDGTKVKMDGTIILLDGTTLNLVEGEGMIIDAPIATAETMES